MLARREHSFGELSRKLAAKGFPADTVHEVLVALQAEGLQSDERFVESYVHHRALRGYGPLRIRQELLERGIDAERAEEVVPEAANWGERLSEVRRKKFGARMPGDYKEQAKQSRFLYSRGFSTEAIRRLFRTDD